MKAQKGHITMNHWQLTLMLTSFIVFAMGLAYARPLTVERAYAVELAVVGSLGIVAWMVWYISDVRNRKDKTNKTNEGPDKG